MTTGKKRILSILLALSMVVGMSPIGISQAADNTSDTKTVLTTLQEGTYLVPVAEVLLPGKTNWGTSSSGISWQVNRYIAVNVSQGKYHITMPFYAGNAMEDVQVATGENFTNVVDFYNAKMNSNYLQGKVSEEGITALEGAAVAEAVTGSAIQTLDTEKTELSCGMAEFSYDTDTLPEDIRLMVLSTLYNNDKGTYNKSAVVKAKIVPDWSNAVKMSESRESYSVMVSNYGEYASTLADEKTYNKLYQSIDWNVQADETESGQYRVTVPVKNVSAKAYQIAKVEMLAKENTWKRASFSSQSSVNFEEIKIEDGSFEIIFADVCEAVCMRFTMEDNTKIYARLYLTDQKQSEYSVSDGKVSLSSKDKVVDQATLQTKEYTQADDLEMLKGDGVRAALTMADNKEYYVYETEVSGSSSQKLNVVKQAVVGITLPTDYDASKLSLYKIVSTTLENGTVYTETNQVSNFYTDGGVMYIPTASYTNDTYLFFENVTTADVTTLSDGIYDVHTTLWNASSNAQSMAASVVEPDAQLLIKGEKKYLKLSFTKSTILTMPAFLSKAYAVDVDAETTTSRNEAYQSGVIQKFWSEDEVREFSLQALSSVVGAETAQSQYESMMFQNNLKYVQEITLDISNSIVKEGIHKDKVSIEFCCDIMDTLYGGVQGSDRGSNNACLMISNPKQNNILTEKDIIGTEDTTDKKELKKVYEDAQCIVANQTNYAKDSYNAFVPTWSKAYAIYNYSQSTQEEVDSVTAELQEALPKLVYREGLSKLLNATSTSKIKKANCDTESYTALTSVRTAAQSVYNNDSATQTAIDEQIELLTAAYQALLPSDVYIETITEAAQEAIDTPQGTASNKRYETMQTAAKKVQETVVQENVTYIEITADYQTMQDAVASLLSTEPIMADGTYIVPITLWKANADTASMGNTALNQKGKLVVENGQGTLYFSFKKMSFSGMEGYLSNIAVMSNIKYNENNYPASYDKTDATVISTYDVVDQYNSEESTDINCAGKAYPKQLSIPVNMEDELIWSEVYVPIMGSMNMGTQICRLKVDYEKAAAYTAPDTTAVEKTLDVVESDTLTNYTVATVENVKDAVATVKATIEDEYATQDDIDNAEVTLRLAYNNLEGSLKEGTYDITASIWKEVEDTMSMSNGLIDSAKLVVTESSTKLLLNVKALTVVMGTQTFTSFAEGFSYLLGEEYTEAEITKKDSEGNAVQFTYTLPVMTRLTAISLKNNGRWQNARLCLDYSSAKETSPEASESPEVSESPEPSKEPEVSEAPKPTASPVVTSSPDSSQSNTQTTSKVVLTLNQSKATIYTKGTNTVQLRATAANGSGSVKWSSNNTKVATVSANGKVTAKKAGKAVITATYGNVTAKCEVTVKKPSITVSKAKVTLKKGKKMKLAVKVTPTGKLKYSSSNKKIAKVSSKGVITARKKGNAKITISCNGVKKTIKVNVK